MAFSLKEILFFIFFIIVCGLIVFFCFLPSLPKAKTLAEVQASELYEENTRDYLQRTWDILDAIDRVFWVRFNGILPPGFVEYYAKILATEFNKQFAFIDANVRKKAGIQDLLVQRDTAQWKLVEYLFEAGSGFSYFRRQFDKNPHHLPGYRLTYTKRFGWRYLESGRKARKPKRLTPFQKVGALLRDFHSRKI